MLRSRECTLKSIGTELRCSLGRAGENDTPPVLLSAAALLDGIFEHPAATFGPLRFDSCIPEIAGCGGCR